MDVEKGHKTDERSGKETARQLEENARQEVKDKNAKRAEAMTLEAEKAKAARDAAAKTEDVERAKKEEAEKASKAVARAEAAYMDQRKATESAEKDVEKAFSEKEKRETQKHFDMMKAGQSEKVSKKNQQESKLEAARLSRYQAGEALRIKTKTAAEKVKAQLVGLEKEKRLANGQVREARDVRADVYKEKAIMGEKDDKEFAQKMDGKETASK